MYLQLAFKAKTFLQKPLNVIVLKNNRVIFGDLRAIQDKGIATGTGPATAIENLILGMLEQDNLSPELLAFLTFIKR